LGSQLLPFDTARIMDLRKAFLRRLVPAAKSGDCWLLGIHKETWTYASPLRNTLLRMERGEEQAWDELMELRERDPTLAAFMRAFADQKWPCVDLKLVEFLRAFLSRVDRGDSVVWDELVEHGRKLANPVTTSKEFGDFFKSFCFSQSLECIAEAADGKVDGIRPSDLDFLIEVLRSDAPSADAKPLRERKSRSRIMYIERKADKLTGEARIGRVTFSKSGRSVYYQGRRFETQSGRGYKSNYFEVESGEEYWISGPRRDGQDRLYGGRQPIEIDDDVREEYWTAIRKLPECIGRKVV
jgi:hypothetical protein